MAEASAQLQKPPEQIQPVGVGQVVAVPIHTAQIHKEATETIEGHLKEAGINVPSGTVAPHYEADKVLKEMEEGPLGVVADLADHAVKVGENLEQITKGEPHNYTNKNPGAGRWALIGRLAKKAERSGVIQALTESWKGKGKQKV